MSFGALLICFELNEDMAYFKMMTMRIALLNRINGFFKFRSLLFISNSFLISKDSAFAKKNAYCCVKSHVFERVLDLVEELHTLTHDADVALEQRQAQNGVNNQNNTKRQLLLCITNKSN